MRTDVCFPCMEYPQRCYFLSVPADFRQKSQALSCTRRGEITATPTPKRWEEWHLSPGEAGTFRIVHAADHAVLVCNSDGTLRAVPNKAQQGENADGAYWSLEDQDDLLDDGNVRIRSFHGNCYLASNFGGIRTQSDPTCPTTQWKLEYLTGELVYIQQSNAKNLILCDNLGNLKTSTQFGGWEIWRFLEAGNNQVRITSWTHQHKLLSCDAFGNVVTTEDRLSPATLWTVRRAPKGSIVDGVIIQSSANGRLLRSDGKTISSAGFIDGSTTTWQLTSAHRDRYYLSSSGYDLRISLQKDTCLKTSEHRRDCEVWLLEKLDNGFVQLRSEKFGRLLRYDGQGLSVTVKELPCASAGMSDSWRVHPSVSGEGLSVIAKEFKDNLTTKWRIIESPTGRGVCIVSAMEPYLALSCNSKGEMEAVDHQGPYESWNLEPCMPGSLQGWQINLMIGGAVGAALLGPAVAVGVLGFGAEGMAAAGATLMVAEAGEAAAAAGLGLAGAAAAMGTGAAVGLSATGIVVASSKRERGEGTDLRHSDQDRPFCEWKNW